MSKRLWAFSSIVLLLGCTLTACRGDSVDPAAPATMQIGSPDFAPGQFIPAQFACGGADVSPTLHWSMPPAGTQSQVLILSDPDAPLGTFTHWILYNVPPTATAIAGHIAQTAQLPDGSMQAKNDADSIGYFGPCPPGHATHRYFFRVYALNAPLPLAPGASKHQVLEAMRGHVLAKGEFMSRYHR